MSHEAKLRDLEVVKDVHRDAALVTRLKEQGPTGEAGHVPPCEARRGSVGQIELPFGCEVTACAGRLLREEDTGKLGAATRCNRNPQTSRHRLRYKDEDSAEPQRECAPLAGTPREPKEPARGRVCITRQAGCNISHESHLGEDSPAHSQWVSEASKGLQLTLQSSELVSVKQRKDQLRDKGGKIIMSLYDRRPQGILQVVEWRAVPDGFKQSFKVRDAQQGCHWRQCFLLKGNSDQGRIQIGKEDVSNILSRKNSTQVRSCDDRGGGGGGGTSSGD